MGDVRARQPVVEIPMSRLSKVNLCLIAISLLTGTAAAQVQKSVPDSNLTTKSVQAIGYKVGGGSTRVDLRGTEIMPGATTIEISLIGMTQPSTLGAEFLTYVLWVVTPDGRSGNTGEIIVNKNGEGKLKVTTPAQAFALLVTAEPYFAIRFPS